MDHVLSIAWPNQVTAFVKYCSNLPLSNLGANFMKLTPVHSCASSPIAIKRIPPSSKDLEIYAGDNQLFLHRSAYVSSQDGL